MIFYGSSAVDKRITQYANYREKYQFDIEGLKKAREEYSTGSISKNQMYKYDDLCVVVDYIDYVISLLNKEGYVKIKWVLEDMALEPDGLYLEQMTAVGFDIMDYLVSDKKTTIIISYAKIFNAIAFEIAHRDLGISDEEIDNFLKDKSIVAMYKDTELYKIQNLCPDIYKSVYNHVRCMRIKDTPYSQENGKFSTPLGVDIKADLYGEVVDEVCRQIITYALNSIAKSQGYSGENVNMVAVLNDKIYLEADSDRVNEVLLSISPSIKVCMYGRKFDIQPKIELF